ncbi:MAG: efflux RND transporter periplasmic adaptor subunit [Sedimentisphaerales bacterium]|nr:efflux RND transporter periplasmic adaptor subunit [Sedimentisphaerales bacterium]
MKNSMFKTFLGRIGLILIIIAAFLVGYAVKALRGSRPPEMEHDHVSTGSEDTEQWWTCSMHPQVRQPKPGKCPICFMDLIPAASEGMEVGEREIAFSNSTVKLMEIQTTPVERKFVDAEIRMVGKVDYDEIRVKNITAWVPGRIDRLYVDFTGITVRKGDHMVDLYSPELISAQAELLQALKAAGNITTTTSDLVKGSTLATLEAARDKLRWLGLTREQIGDIEDSSKPVTHITIYSPMGGVVIHKNANEGLYVGTGTSIYQVADLSQLWIKLDAYESDLAWLRYGQGVEFTTEAYPGELFNGTISFIDPILNDKTRTVKLRVNVDNTAGKLKPGMFVRAIVRSRVAEGGRIMAPEMAGKWICPMHPAVVKSQPGSCDICGMDLMTTESLGYVVDTPNEAPLVIPDSAPLITGSRAVVYVQLPNEVKPTFEGRQVTLGSRAGHFYLVKDGLSEGEVVVTHGNFKIDSALQIQAKPSMMSADDSHSHELYDVPDKYREHIWAIIDKYLLLQEALASDRKEDAAQAANEAQEILSKVDMGLLSKAAHEVWMGSDIRMNEALTNIKEAAQIEVMRQAFERFSNELIPVVKQYGIPGNRVLYRIHCPMAFNNKGADWLQRDEDIRNPYFGASMLKCGEVTEVISVKMK